MKRLMLFLLLAVGMSNAHIDPSQPRGVDTLMVRVQNGTGNWDVVARVWLPLRDTTYFGYYKDGPYDTVNAFDFTVNGYRPVFLDTSVLGYDDWENKVYVMDIHCTWNGDMTSIYGNAHVDTTQPNQVTVNFQICTVTPHVGESNWQMLSRSILYPEPKVSVVPKVKATAIYHPKTPEYFDVLGRKVVSFANSGLYVSSVKEVLEWKTR